MFGLIGEVAVVVFFLGAILGFFIGCAFQKWADNS